MRPIRPTLAASSIAAVLRAGSACGPSDDNADDSSASQPGDNGDDKVQLPGDLEDRLKEHGIDVDKWKDGAWKNWDKDDWLREAKDFVNPVIEGLWDPDRMRDADKNPDRGVDEGDISGDQGVTDPTPEPVKAQV